MERLKVITCFMSILLFTLTLPIITFANSAEPPNLTVIVSFPSDDLTLSIRFADGDTTDAVLLQKEQRAWEAYYRFFYGMVASTRPSLEGATLIVHSSEKNFESPLPTSAFSQYNNLITLNVASESIVEGQSFTRLLLLVSIRVALTLFIVEAIAFALILKERKKGRAIAYALTANLASLILGGMLIAYLPI